ncbi:ervatamin-B-like [Neltuma alba]|uniref:ervatamin-B-like n=1 Tax=Neltuma alba TaxID=207710 RepID=UPI0010A3983F|nr:ervatamin-B-like [Prosopis alba]
MSDEYSIRNIDLDKFTSEQEIFRLFQMWKKETQREYQTLEEEQIKFMFIGTCWAFSATGAMEGINKIVSGQLLALSEQQLISCDQKSKGCKGGGWHVNAFNFDMSSTITAQKKSATIDGYNYWYHNPVSESSLRCLVLQQPVSVSLFASRDSQLYNGAIFKGDDCSGIDSCKHDHAVLILGYGSLGDSQDYWIVKNSWGSNWGQHGYILIKTNTGTTQGVCNINCSGAYPTKQTHVSKLAAPI